MNECSILQIEDAMIQKLKELFRDELFQRKDGEKVLINIFNNFIPMKNYQEKVKEKKESEDDIPFILDRKSTRLNSSHANISYAVFCLKKKKKTNTTSDV